MIRKFVSRLLKKGGLHPDMTLGPLLEGREEPLKLLPTASAKSAAPDLHPDLDLDFELVEPLFVTLDEADFDALDFAVSFEELEQEEDALGESPAEPGSFAVQPDHQHLDIDWNLELAWAAASGAMEVAGVGWETFDFDVSGLGPDPEALAEDNSPPAESVNARDRRLDGVAAELVLSLGALRSADRQALHRRFRTVVHEFPHPASHAALLRLLAEGIGLEEIEEAAQLRCVWRDQAWLWAEKRVATGVWSVRRRASQRLAFGWPTAVRLLRTFGLVECERAMGKIGLTPVY